MKALRDKIEKSIHSTTGLGLGDVDYDHPKGDPGLYGPASVIWQVHADFTSMLIGGISALFLQMLHPLVLAGVWDHSNFRDDMLGRLRRTARFIAGTTYGNHADALHLIDTVRRIHDHVQGQLPDGTAYSANDPALLNWVHVSEASGFLRAHLVYKNPSLALLRQNQYFEESALVAQMLGARDVPQSWEQIQQYFAQTRPMLRCDDRTREVRDVLIAAVSDTESWRRPSARLFLWAAIELLPKWASEMLELEAVPGPTRARRMAVLGIAGVFRWAVRDGSAYRARRRVGAN